MKSRFDRYILEMTRKILREAKSASMEYYLIVDIDERGEYGATVYDPSDKVIWDVDTETVHELIEDGFLKYKPDQDLGRLSKYLADAGVIPKGSEIYSEEDFQDRTQQ